MKTSARLMRHSWSSRCARTAESQDAVSANRRNRAGAGRESDDAAPLRARQGRAVGESRLRHHARAVSCTGTRSSRARTRVAASRWAPATPVRQFVQHARRARQHHALRLQADRGRVHRAAALRPHGARCRLLGGWREATEVGFYGFGAAGQTPETTARTTGFSSRTRRRLLEFWPTRGAVPAARRPRGLRSGSRRLRRKRDIPPVDRRLHARDASRTRCAADLPALAGNGRRSTRVPRPATRGAAGSTASRCTTSRTRTANSGSNRWTTRPSSTSRSCARRGSCRSMDWSRRPTSRTASRFRSS